MRNIKTGFLIGVIALGGLLTAAQAQAASITFTYNCTIVNATTCTAGSTLGSITLTDSSVDQNRVDIDVWLNLAVLGALQPNYPPTGLNNFFLNYGGVIPANSTFKMVLQSDAAGVFNHDGGNVDVNPNNFGPLSTTLDFRLDPDSSVPSATFSGSLALFADSGHAETNLDVSMFKFKDANGLLYSAFDTMSTNHSFFGGATIASEGSVGSTEAVPEPATMSLLGLGLIGAAGLLRRRRS